MKEETKFVLERASQEAVRAINSASDEAGQAHQELAVRYSEKASASLSNGDVGKCEA